MNLNLYNYGAQNPTTYVDLNGLSDIAIAVYNVEPKENKKNNERGTFNGRAVRAKSDVNIDANTGTEILAGLKNNSSKEDPIKNLYIFTHSSDNAFFANNDEGFYNEKSLFGKMIDTLQGQGDYATMDDLSRMMDSGEIVFAADAQIILLGCNTAKGTNKDSNTNNIAKSLSIVLGESASVVAADGYSAEDKTTGKFSSTRGTHRNKQGIQNATPGRWQTFKGGVLQGTSSTNSVQVPQR